MPIWIRPGSKAWHCHGNHRRPLISYQTKSLENSGPWHICSLQRGGQEEVTLAARLPSVINIIVAQRLHVTKCEKNWEIKQIGPMEGKRLWVIQVQEYNFKYGVSC